MEIDISKTIASLVQKNIEKIGNKLFELGKDSYKQLLTKTQVAFNDYLIFSYKKYSYIKTILYKDTPVFLDDFYVHTNINYNGNHVIVKNITDILNINRFSIITGTAGAGKSTFMKYLFLDSIKELENIPIFIELRNLNNTDLSLEDFIFDSLRNSGFNLESKFLFKALESGKFNLFFDGYDELDFTIKEKVTKEIQTLSDKYHENNFLISSRPDSSFIAWNYYTELSINELSKEKSIELIKKLNYDYATKEKFLDELNKGLYEKHKSFVSNPLLLTIMLMTFNQFAEIPDKMHLFYEQAFDTLYNKHDATKSGYKRVMYCGLAKDEFEKILSCFSFISYIKGDYSFSLSKINLYLSQTKKITGINFDIDSYVKDLIKSVCLILQDGFIYTFSHKTFQEYFTAIYLDTLDENILNEFLLDVLRNSFSDKVLLTLFELNQEKIERLLIVPLLEELETKIQYYSSNKLQAYRNYLMLVFREFNIGMVSNNYDDDEYMVTLSRKENEMRKYHDIVNFVNERYADLVFNLTDTAKLTIEQIKEKYTNPNELVFRGIPEELVHFEKFAYQSELSTELLKYDEIFNDIFNESDGLAVPVYKAIEWVEKIKIRLSKQKKDIMSILIK